ncbi:hypothetical protein D6C90_06071 [Aureobasidium pullulans]|uniref:Peptidase S1 domain-containing protein n=1 Tax=Aureobasidium pullulans TaxID=5580 RepID=A0A4S9UP95_AURPU|nr:hypothetical protein D6C90_06071 [Aureobasidium pullulans]
MLALTYIFGLLIAIAHAQSHVHYDNVKLPKLIHSNRSMGDHTAAIFRINPNTTKVSLVCNGVLLDRRTVLTLGRCIDPAKVDSLLVAMSSDVGPTLWASVEVMEHHPKFDKNATYVNDLHDNNDDDDDDHDDDHDNNHDNDHDNDHDDDDDDDDDVGLSQWNFAMLKLNETLKALGHMRVASPSSGQRVHTGAWYSDNYTYEFEEYSHLALSQARCQQETLSCHDVAGQHICIQLDRIESDSDTGDNLDDFFGGPAFDDDGRLVGLYASEGDESCETKSDVQVMANVTNVIDWIADRHY